MRDSHQHIPLTIEARSSLMEHLGSHEGVWEAMAC